MKLDGQRGESKRAALTALLYIEIWILESQCGGPSDLRSILLRVHRTAGGPQAPASRLRLACQRCKLQRRFVGGYTGRAFAPTRRHIVRSKQVEL